MTVRAADDYAAIARRMGEIAGELPVRDNDKREAAIVCAACAGAGWIVNQYFKASITCLACGNPENKPGPAART